MKLEELIKACKKNDRTAQSQLFEQYKDVLYYISLKYSRNEVEAEDNLHDAFMVIFDKIGTYKNKGSFEGWMKRITMFKAIDRYKNNKYVPTEFNDNILEADVSISSETDSPPLDILLKYIQELPDGYRLVFNMYQMDGYSHKEVARILGISEGTSKSNYHRAKLLLQKRITTEQPHKTQTHGK
ncbi:sigma-70 family RNA polymerase sigma factor [Rasiella rasia]|uniref:Sigma-70 family RNA polymerase sigma factor n=1 Tax=Rasiella rasia TaxID=2744027 RepID=A0A6G6GPL3_9FLAO|nr:sigma-70 family RNA polymerase sigma factor [Rasiella rasia]QIE60410.1 sigma-70 family RNA polymerase sigma factor [Rasiella rasia]